MATNLPQFPVTQSIPEIKKQLATSNHLVLEAAPGAGKTTIVPLALLSSAWLTDKKIIMLEPRRLAARRAASRMADLLHERVGQTVGYQIKADQCHSEKTKILVVTEGILTRRLQTDPSLEDIAIVIFDEFHERNLHADLALAFCLQSQEILREDLKILIMSATMDSQLVSALLNNAPIIRSQGQCYPVENIYLPQNLAPPEQYRLAAFVSNQIIQILTKTHGNILVFLPGAREIKQVENDLQHHFAKENYLDLLVAPLYGNLTQAQQDKAILPTHDGVRKIVLATNIAETSLTIEGISTVIDSGFQRVLTFNPRSGMNRLQTVHISQDASIQRSGRAGRLSVGKCYRLWHENRQQHLVKHRMPEILNSDLTQMMLELANWGVQHVDELQWLDVPSPGAASQATALLQSLGALNTEDKITQHGKAMLSLGVHPRLAHMMINAKAIGSSNTACLLAALLTEKDIMPTSAEKTADISSRLAVLRQHQRKTHHNRYQVNHGQCDYVLSAAILLSNKLKHVRTHTNSADQYLTVDTQLAGVLLGFAYPDRIAQCRDKQSHRYLTSSGKGAYLHPNDSLTGETYIVVADLDDRKKEGQIYLAASISLAQLEEFFQELINNRISIEWNPKQLRVDTREKTTLGSIVLTETQNTPVSQDQVHDVLLQGVQMLGLTCLTWSNDAEMLKQRVNFFYHQKASKTASHQMLQTIEIPNFSNLYLLKNLDNWLRPHLNNQTSIKHLQKFDLHKVLLSYLTWDQQQQLNNCVPSHISVPSGSKIAIDYSDPGVPVLAVRLQELFGLEDSPTIMNGQIKLLIHLLSPAYRPMQVTTDLRNFWLTTYHEVKKELKGKYKRHYWPDEPLTAKATNKTKKFM